MRSRLLKISSLLAANLLSLIFFIDSNRSVIQLLWIYFAQALIAAIFYYKRISKLRWLELKYRKSNKPKAAAAFEKQIRYQIPNEQFMFLFICVLPLVGLAILLASISAGSIVVESNGQSVGTVNLIKFAPNTMLIFIGSAAFFVHYLVEYLRDCRLTSTGLAIQNRYSTAARAFFSLLSLFVMIPFGVLVYYYFGNNAMFGVYIAAKTIMEGLLAYKGISL